MVVPVRRRVLAGVVVLAALATTALLAPGEPLLGWFEGVVDDPVAFAGLLVVVYLCRPLLAWPTVGLSVLVGYGYGVALGVPVALAGAVLTALPVFCFARWVTGSGSCSSSTGAGGVIARARRATERYFDEIGGVRGVTAAKLAPIPADLVTFAAGASGVRLDRFVLGTVIGEAPWTLAAVVVGASAARVTADGLGALGLPLAIGCTFAAALLVAGPAYRYARAPVVEDGP